MKNLSTTKQNKKRENEMEKLKGYSIYKISANQPSELIEITDNKKQALIYLNISDFNNKISNLTKELNYKRNSKNFKNMMNHISTKYDTNSYKVVHMTTNYLVIKE